MVSAGSQIAPDGTPNMTTARGLLPSRAGRRAIQGPAQLNVAASCTGTSPSITLWSTPGGGSARLLVSHGPVELWSWTLTPGDQLANEAHRPGSVELITAHTGTVTLDVGHHHVEVPAGASAWFDATSPHKYSNPGTTTTTITLVVLEPP